MRYSTLLTYPLLFGLGLLAEDFVILAYGEKWRPIIAPMQAFCFYGLVQIAWAGLSPLCYGLGRPDLAFKWYLIGLPINVLALYLGAHYFGVLGVALSKLVLGVFLLATLRTEIMGHVGLPLVRQLAALWPALVAPEAISPASLLGAVAVVAGSLLTSLGGNSHRAGGEGVVGLGRGAIIGDNDTGWVPDDSSARVPRMSLAVEATWWDLAHTLSRGELSVVEDTDTYITALAVRDGDLEAPTLVRRGALVTMEIKTPMMRLTARGKALDNGTLGETVRIRNIQSKRVIQGTVVGLDRVRIAPAGAVAARR